MVRLHGLGGGAEVASQRPSRTRRRSPGRMHAVRSWKERFAVLVAASNALHYPFLTAFNKARVQRVREHNQQHRRGKSGGTAPVTTGAAAGTSAARAAAAGEGVLPPLAVDQVEEPGAKRDKPGGRRGLDGEVEYEFNQGEQLMLQVLLCHEHTDLQPARDGHELLIEKRFFFCLY